MTFVLAAFWLCSVFLVYVWVGYPLLLWVWSAVKPVPPAGSRRTAAMPFVSVIVAVHNEAAALPGKLHDCLQLDYPPDRLEIIVASDGSTDASVAIAEQHAQIRGNIRVLAEPARVGKSAVQNMAVQCADGEIVLFTDVDTALDRRFLTSIAEAFADPGVGGATGAIVWTNQGESGIAAGEGAYWRYEHLLWRLESRLGLLAWGSGACLAVRRELFRPIEREYGEDCVVPLDVVSQGYRVVFKPDALAYDRGLADAHGELRARVRMTLRSFTGTLSRHHLLNPFRHPGLTWAILSHKVFRWLVPYALLVALASSVLLAGRPPYGAILAAQILFYLIGAFGYVLERRGAELPGISAVYAFCLMNLGISLGVARALRGHQMFSYRSEA